MRSTNVIPIGQGCKPVKAKGYTSSKISSCHCKEHFWLYLNVCLGCGEKFHSVRPHAKTCSNKCRMKKSRMKKDKLFQLVMAFAQGDAV